MFVLWWPIYFIWHNVFKVHPFCSMYQNDILCQGWIIFLLMDRLHVACSFICWQTLRSFMHFGYWTQCHCEHGCTNICLSPCSHFFWGICLEIEFWELMFILFDFLRSFCSIFHRGHNILYSHQWGRRVSVSPHPHQHLWFCVASHGGLICVSLITSDVEHLFMGLLVVYLFTLEKCLVIVFWPFMQ